MTQHKKSLGDYIVDRTESLDESFIKNYFIVRNDDNLTRLLDSEQYLLEGSRGSGKTMLMKYAALHSKQQFEQTGIFAVWISFEESIRIERIKIVDSSIDPFLQWTMGKILNEVLNQIIKLKPSSIDKLSDRLSVIFGKDPEGYPQNKIEEYIELLEEYIQLLEKADIEDNKSLNNKTPSAELARILDNPTSFRQFLIELIENFNLQRIVLLFDEAAHVFSHSQQEKFFTFFKSLRHPKIACKAAVYPGITNYGKYFEKGQDAKELRLTWSPTVPEDIKYIKDILKKRIQSFDEDYWNKLTANPNIIKLICICTNGNPRFGFHIIDELQNVKAFQRKKITVKTVINCIRTVIENKWKEFNTLKNRLVKYSSYIHEAENLTKYLFIPNLRDWNTHRRNSNKKLSGGFYISTDVYSKISYLFDILAYSNFIMLNTSKKSIGHNNYGYYIALNPSLLFSDLIIRDISETKNISTAIENNQAYYITSPELKSVINKLHIANERSCSNPKCDYRTDDETFMFCPKCGKEIESTESESLYKILRSHSIENLKLSDKIIDRLKKNGYLNIGQIYDADIENIKKMPYIKEVRSEKIKNAAIEYMAG